MKLQDLYTGTVIDAADNAVERLLAHGFKKLQAEKPKPEKKDEPKRKKA